MKLKRRLRFILIGGIVLLTILAVLPHRKASEASKRLSDALEGGRSVTFVEFFRSHQGPPELVFSRVTASPRQIAGLRSATGVWLSGFTLGAPNCFEPHHRVEIVRSDGTTLRFDVCFLCDQFALSDDHKCVALPSIWYLRLANLFTSAGMRPRSEERYGEMARKHPDYHFIEEAWRAKIEDFEKRKRETSGVPGS